MSCLLFIHTYPYLRLYVLLLKGGKMFHLTQIHYHSNVLMTVYIFNLSKNISTIIKQKSRLRTDCKATVSKINRTLNQQAFLFPACARYTNTPHVPTSSPYFAHIKLFPIRCVSICLFLLIKIIPRA